MIALPLGAYLCVNGFAGGWPSIFYIFGSVGFVWFILWMVLASNSPSQNRLIKDKEQKYIEAETADIVRAFQEGESVSRLIKFLFSKEATSDSIINKIKNAPWGSIMKSKACLAIFFGHSGKNLQILE